MNMQFLSLYLHIPFCRTRCTYCAFNTYTDRDALIPAYVDALCREIRWLGQGEPVHTVYFGGGTPSLLMPAQIGQILTEIHQKFMLLPDSEITLEANPGTVDQSYWDALRETGVNRLSMGMQTASAGELALFARDHTLEDVFYSMEAARRAGFKNISLDLIYGVPNQTLENWRNSIEQALSMRPNHLSAYALGLEAGTELTRQVRHGELPEPDDDMAADMYDLATKMLASAGMEQYEISNWALPDQASRHNIQYWRNLPYLGLGAGAHGYIAGHRTVNVMRPEVYIERLNSQNQALEYPRTAAIQSIEEVTRDQEIFETLMMGLRLLKEGIRRQDFETRFGESLDNLYGREIRRLQTQKLLYEVDDTLYLTHEARLLSNRVFEAFVR
jgi:oxygen-independent coproporphyrinogen III oxidase